MKKKRGRKSLLSEAGNVEWSDILNRIIYGSADWRVIRLRQLVLALKKEQATAQRSMLLKEQKACRGMLRKKLEPLQKRQWQRRAADCDKALRETGNVLAALERGDEKEWQLADNYLSARKVQWERVAAEKRYALLDEIDALWHAWSAQCERAVLNGDTDWFERQAKIAKGGLPQRVQFNAKVIDRLETEMWATHIRQGDNREDLTLTPAGKVTSATAGQIYDSLDKVECPTERQPHRVMVEGAPFENRERCCTAIRKLAEDLKAVLRKEQGKHPRKKPSKPLSTDFYHGRSNRARGDRRAAIEKLKKFVSTE